MPVVSVNVLWTGRGGTETHLRRRTYRETYEVLTDSITDDEKTVTDAAGIPRLGRAHPRDALAIVTEIEPEQSDESPFIWRVSVKYDTKPELPEAFQPEAPNFDAKDRPDNPLLRPVVWSVGSEDTTKAAVKWYAVDDKRNVAKKLTPILNSARLPFDPPPTIEWSRTVVRAVKNISAQTSLVFFDSIQNAINAKPWRGIPALSAKLKVEGADGKFENGVNFIEMKIAIAIEPDGWHLQLLDCGYAELTERTDPATGKPVQSWTKIRDPFGQEATEPVPLNGQGHKLAPGADPVFLRGLTQNLKLANFRVLLGF